MSKLHIIFTRDEAVLISKQPYGSWRDIQDEYDGYMTSLGPWDPDVVASWLSEEYKDLFPLAREQVSAILSSDQMACRVSFARKA